MSVFLEMAAQMDVALGATKRLVAGLEVAATKAEAAAKKISEAREVADRAGENTTSTVTNETPGAVNSMGSTAALGDVVDLLKRQVGRR